MPVVDAILNLSNSEFKVSAWASFPRGFPSFSRYIGNSWPYLLKIPNYFRCFDFSLTWMRDDLSVNDYFLREDWNRTHNRCTELQSIQYPDRIKMLFLSFCFFNEKCKRVFTSAQIRWRTLRLVLQFWNITCTLSWLPL